MKFNCGPSYEERQMAKCKWHRWFAWRPVRLQQREPDEFGYMKRSHDCRWLETVERRGRCLGDYEYRALETK